MLFMTTLREKYELYYVINRTIMYEN